MPSSHGMRERWPRTARFRSSSPARLAALLSLTLGACGITERTVEELSGTGGAAGTAHSHPGVGGGPVTGSGGSPGGKQSPPTGGLYVPMDPTFGSAGGPGLPAGGRASGFGCGNLTPIPLSCPAGPAPVGPVGGAGGENACASAVAADGGQAGASVGQGGAGAGDGPSLPGPARLLIDDLEDGDITTFSVLDGQGDWFVANDGSGQQFPFPCAAVSVTESGAHAMHTYGHSFVSMAGGYSLLGFRLNSDHDGCKKAVDASEFTGVEFLARGEGLLRFFIGTTAINPPGDLGTCEVGCYDAHGLSLQLGPDWGLYRIPFRYLSQEGWGSVARFDPSQILSVMWSAKVERGSVVPSSCFDFWIDDVAFYRE